MPARRRTFHAPYPIVLVDWVDSQSGRGWVYAGDAQTEPAECQSAGFLVHQNRRCLTISDAVHLDQGEVEQVHKTMAIPRAAVRRVRTLVPGVRTRIVRR